MKQLYPSENFFKFGSSPSTYLVSDVEIDKWIKKCVAVLEKDMSRDRSIYATGDTKIFVERFYHDGSDNSNYYYTVTVCKDYEENEFERDVFENLQEEN